MPNNKPSINTWIIRILLVVILIQLWNYCRDKKQITINPKSTTKQSLENTKLPYQFNLTECLGKDLVTPATFTVDPRSTNWLLDFNNGTTLIYTIISGNEHDPLCGLKAKDNNGDRCEICIKKDGEGRTTITFNYSGKKLIYYGYYNK